MASNLYADLEELKRARKVTDTNDDVDLTAALQRASRALDERCRGLGGHFYADSVASARGYYTADDAYYTRKGEVLAVDDISSAAGLVVEVGDGTTWVTVTGYDLAPDNALVKGRAVEGLIRPLGCWSTSPRVRVTALWGWPAVPDNIAQATLLLANRRFMRRNSPEGVAGWADQGAIRVSRFDPDIEDLVADYVLPGIG
jgi:hypothetical protein